MSSNRTATVEEYLPTQGLLYFDEQLKYVVSKPKIMPLKSMTLEKVRFHVRLRLVAHRFSAFQLETLQNEAQDKLKQQENLGLDS